MSDDRFKEARRDLIDEEDDGKESEAADSGEEEEDLSSAKTAMVDLDELQEGAAKEAASDDGETAGGDGSRPRRGSSPTSKTSASESPFGETADSEEIDDPGGGADRRRGDDRFGGRGGDSPESNRRRQTSQGTAPVGSGSSSPTTGQEENRGAEAPNRGGGSQPDYREEGSLDEASGAGQSPQGGGESDQQVFVPGDDDGHRDAKTEFVNLNDFADQPSGDGGAGGQRSQETDSQTFSPGDDTSGYEGSTQFVNLEELAGGGPRDEGEDAIFNDSILQQGYEFGREDIEQGEATLIYADNPLGEAVLLRQVWSGEAADMPRDMRQRVQELSELEIPGLLDLNGMVITDTGCWVEFDRPTGRRLDDLLASEGGQPPERVHNWVEQIGETLTALHEEDYVYANLMPDAVWVEENRTVLEPFDILALRDRADLGEFGPPELRADGEHQSLTPQTDVYSLGVLTAACLSGLPLDGDSIAAISDDSTIRAIRKAVSDAPNDRYAYVGMFVEDVLRDELTLADIEQFFGLEFTHLLAIVFSLGVAGLGGFIAYNRQTGGDSKAESSKSAVAAKEKKSKKKGGGESSGEKEKTQKETKPRKVEVEPKGNYEKLDQLTVTTSYRYNPPADAEKSLEGEERKKRVDELKQQFKENRKAAEDSEKASDYRKAAESLVKLIHIGGDAETWAKKKLDKLYEKEPMQDYRRKKLDLAWENLREESFTDAEIALKDLYAVTADQPARTFVERISNPAFVVKTGDSSDSD